MKNGRVAITAVLTLVLATALFYFAEHQISSTLLEASLRPEIRNALEESMNDQKELRSSRSCEVGRIQAPLRQHAPAGGTNRRSSHQPRRAAAPLRALFRRRLRRECSRSS